MHQLSSFDTQVLALEDGRNHAHVSLLAILDPSAAPERLSLDAVRTLVAERLHLVAPLRWRLAEVPFALDYPYWVDADDIDLAFHVRELALPAPGNEAQLTEQVARIVSRPLARERPLWELYVIRGLADGRTAILFKIHHAAVDGVSMGEALGLLLDPDPDPGHVPPPLNGRATTTAPGQLSMLARGLAGVPRQQVRALRALPRVLPHLDKVPHIRIGRPAVPATTFAGPITPHRRIALSSQSLSDVKRIKEHFGVTVNDVVVAICAGAVRSWLEERGELPDAPLVTMIPVSVRTPAEQGTYGNKVSAMLVEIPTDEADPAERVRRAHLAMNAAKECHEALPTGVIGDANLMVPPALLRGASRVAGMVISRDAPVNTVISNVPGSRTAQYFASARVEAIYPISAVMDGVRLNLSLWSHCDTLNFGIVCDRDLTTDPWPIADALHTAQAELLELVS